VKVLRHTLWLNWHSLCPTLGSMNISP